MYIKIWYFISFDWQNTNIGIGWGCFDGEIVLEISPQGTIPTINNIFDIYFVLLWNRLLITYPTLSEF